MIKKFKGSKWERARQRGFVKEIQKVFSRAKMPFRRENQKYTLTNAYQINCFGHSVLNFSNQDIRKICKNYKEEFFNFLWIYNEFDFRGKNLKAETIRDVYQSELLSRVKKLGLKIKECDLDEELNDNEWRVALYFKADKNEEDFHFFKQEKDGTWSSKAGQSRFIQKFNTLPCVFRDGYKLQKIFMITNPYLSKEMQEEKDE